MGILYIMSVIILLVAFILIKKSEKEINIISFIGISIVTLFCYNTFICYILTFFTIPIKLWVLAIINIVIASLIGISIFKNKKIQKYIFDKIDIIYICIIAIIIGIIVYIYFGFPFNVNYEIGGDSATHFIASIMFAKSDGLLACKQESDYIFGTLSSFRPASYVNSGLLMKSIYSDIDTFKCFNIFVIFGILTLFLTGINMYSALNNWAQNKKHKLWALVISIICILGYPLNSFLFGFEYLSMGILIISSIINFVYYYEKEKIDIKYFILIISFLNLGLFLSYYMFVPFVFPALWIYFCIKNYNIKRKLITKELVLLLLITLLIPFLLGYIYTISSNIYGIFINESEDIGNILGNSSNLLNNSFKGNGYTYINLYSNMLLLLPLAIYLFIKDNKENSLKNNIFIGLLLLFAIIFILILIIGNSLGKVSMYYLSKNYYVLWVILLYCNYKALILLSVKSNFLPRLFISIYVILMIICTIFSNVKVEFYIKNMDETIYSVMEVFGANKTIMFNKPIEFDQDGIGILKYAKENLDFNKEIEVVTDLNAYFWQYVLLEYANKEEALNSISNGQAKLFYKLQNIVSKFGKVDYVIYFYDSEIYDIVKYKMFENSEIIYENDAGGILRYIK